MDPFEIGSLAKSWIKPLSQSSLSLIALDGIDPSFRGYQPRALPLSYRASTAPCRTRTYGLSVMSGLLYSPELMAQKLEEGVRFELTDALRHL